MIRVVVESLTPLQLEDIMSFPGLKINKRVIRGRRIVRGVEGGKIVFPWGELWTRRFRYRISKGAWETVLEAFAAPEGAEVIETDGSDVYVDGELWLPVVN